MILQAVYDELVYGGHLLALGTASIACAVALVAGLSPTIPLALMAYLFTYGAYTVNRATEKEQDEISHPERTAYLNKRRRFLPAIAVACFLVGYVLAFGQNLYFFFALIVPLVLSILYSVRSRGVQRITGTRRLKDGLLVKNLVISFGWSLIPFLVGLYYLQVPEALVLLSPFIFMRLMENTIFFDIRDVPADVRYGTRTVPAVFGEKVTSRVLNLVDSLSIIYLVAAVILRLLPGVALPLVVFPLYSFCYRLLLRRANENVVRDLMADGEYILWMPVILLGKI